MFENKEKQQPPLSIMIFTGLFGAMQLIILLSRTALYFSGDVNATQAQLLAGTLVDIVIIASCILLWKMRKLGVWLLIPALTLLSLYKVSSMGEPVGDMISFAIPLILIALACTLPHYKQMR